MKRSDFQPLLEKVTCRFKSWTVKHPSYAGRLELIKSVIYYVITLWRSSLFCRMSVSRLWFCGRIPHTHLEETESHGNQFIPLKSVGSWIETIAGIEQGFCYKTCLVDLCRLWVSWVRVNLIGTTFFWEINGQPPWKLDLERYIQAPGYGKTFHCLWSHFL